MQSESPTRSKTATVAQPGPPRVARPLEDDSSPPPAMAPAASRPRRYFDVSLRSATRCRHVLNTTSAFHQKLSVNASPTPSASAPHTRTPHLHHHLHLPSVHNAEVRDLRPAARSTAATAPASTPSVSSKSTPPPTCQQTSAANVAQQLVKMNRLHYTEGFARKRSLAQTLLRALQSPSRPLPGRVFHTADHRTCLQ